MPHTWTTQAHLASQHKLSCQCESSRLNWQRRMTDRHLNLAEKAQKLSTGICWHGGPSHHTKTTLQIKITSTYCWFILTGQPSLWGYPVSLWLLKESCPLAFMWLDSRSCVSLPYLYLCLRKCPLRCSPCQSAVKLHNQSMQLTGLSGISQQLPVASSVRSGDRSGRAVGLQNVHFVFKMWSTIVFFSIFPC